MFSVNLITLLVSLSQVMSRPNGAPKCEINQAVIAAAHGKASDDSLGYFLDVKPAGNNNWDITIQNKAGKLKWILMLSMISYNPIFLSLSFLNLCTDW